MTKSTTLASFLFILLPATLVSEVRGQSQVYREGAPYSWSVYDYPDPNSLDFEQQRQCGRDMQSSVCDPNAIISKFEAYEIDKAIQDVYANTTCGCYECRQQNKGYIIRVAILPKMTRIFPNSGNSSYQRLRDAQMYSYILSTRWNMDGLCNEALLILYARDDDILYTLTRQETARKLSNRAVQRTSIGVRSYFDREDTISQGLLEMIRRYKAILKS